VKAFTVFVTSPKKSRWHEVKKAPGSRMLYLPVYSKEEIFRLRDLCFPHLDDISVDERYCKWGGIPRTVLLQTSSEDQQELESKIRALNYGDTLALLDGVEPSKAVTDVAVHIKIKVS
jgi:hypothetical protein